MLHAPRNDRTTLAQQAGLSHVAVAAKPFTLSTVAFTLVILAAIGQLYNNIALAHVAGFAITLPLLLLGSAAGITMFVPRRPPIDDTPFFIGIILIAWTIVSAGLLGIIGNGEWQKSAQLFMLYVFSYMLISRLHIDQDDIKRVTPTLLTTIIICGILGVAQFCLLNYTSVPAVVPEPWGVSTWDPSVDIYRTGGILRAAGLSYEPSTYAIALSVAAVVCLFFCSVSSACNRILLIFALVLLILGSLVSYSISGWAVGILPILLGLFIGRSNLRMNMLVLSVFGTLLLGMLYTQGMLPGISERVDSIASGDEESANVRVAGALTLLVWPSDHFTDFVAGYGIGMEEHYAPLIGEVYGRRFGVYVNNIHNIFTVVKVTQGWMGILLHVLLILATFRPLGIRDWSLYAPLLLLVVMLHFASGYYLDPIFWAVMTLIAILRTANFQTSTQPAQAVTRNTR